MAYDASQFKVGQESQKLVTLTTLPVSVPVGANKLPGKLFVYTDDKGKAENKTILVGSLSEESVAAVRDLVVGDQFVVVKVFDGKWWNITGFRDKSTFVHKGSVGGKPAWQQFKKDDDAITIGNCFKIAGHLIGNDKTGLADGLSDDDLAAKLGGLALKLALEHSAILALYKELKKDPVPQAQPDPQPVAEEPKPASSGW